MESDQRRCVNGVVHAFDTHIKGSCVTRRTVLFPTSVWEERGQRSRKEEDVLREAYGTEREREREGIIRLARLHACHTTCDVSLTLERSTTGVHVTRQEILRMEIEKSSAAENHGTS